MIYCQYNTIRVSLLIKNRLRYIMNIKEIKYVSLFVRNTVPHANIIGPGWRNFERDYYIDLHVEL